MSSLYNAPGRYKYRRPFLFLQIVRQFYGDKRTDFEGEIPAKNGILRVFTADSSFFSERVRNV